MEKPLLHKNLGFAQGLALYLAAVLGTGILIVPLLAWREGGPASLIAWVVLGFLGLALAWTFATAGAQLPDAGGIQSMIGRVFGPSLETLTRYLIFFTVPVGAVPAAFIFAQHLSAAFHLPDLSITYLAFGSWILITSANYFGIRVSANAQLILSGLLVVLLAVFVVGAFPSVRKEHFFPFAPMGFRGIANAALLIFWSFVGWEAIAHLAEEFRDPKRDMIRSAVVAGVIVVVFYLAVSFVLIGVGVLNFNTEQNAPLVEMAQTMFGKAGRVFTGVLAAVICLGTMNAYVAGLSRLGYAMSRDGDLPRFLSRLDPATGTPTRSVLFQFLLNCSALSVQIFFHLPLRYFFVVSNVAFLVLYILGCVSVARLLRGRRGAVAAAYGSAAVCAAMLPFAGGALLYPSIVAVSALAVILFKRGERRGRGD